MRVKDKIKSCGALMKIILKDRAAAGEAKCQVAFYFTEDSFKEDMLFFFLPNWASMSPTRTERVRSWSFGEPNWTSLSENNMTLIKKTFKLFYGSCTLENLKPRARKDLSATSARALSNEEVSWSLQWKHLVICWNNEKLSCSNSLYKLDCNELLKFVSIK